MNINIIVIYILNYVNLVKNIYKMKVKTLSKKKKFLLYFILIRIINFNFSLKKLFKF